MMFGFLLLARSVGFRLRVCGLRDRPVHITSFAKDPTPRVQIPNNQTIPQQQEANIPIVRV